ncbi:MAG: helix-turn-helix transcriptional regulator [Ruminococcaceae bacterium]|nr:helix-turn-helix transcriptional regulator [Oscillospiraceae bacterium]
MKMTIGANIKRLRTAKNITQEQLSVAMNVTCAAVSKWERGRLTPISRFFNLWHISSESRLTSLWATIRKRFRRISTKSLRFTEKTRIRTQKPPARSL